jgi:hypothetical protein
MQIFNFKRMRSNIKFDLYCWACDFSSNRGEGVLAQNYIKGLSKILKKKIFVQTPNDTYNVKSGIIKINNTNTQKKTKLNLSFFENYLTPFIGIFYLWKNYLRGRGVCYLNFLPLWNIFIFFFLPPQTHLGPLTGFVFKKKVTGVNFFLRKYLNFFLFKINLKILFFRQNAVYFSTDLLKPLIRKQNRRRIFFNYLINLVDIKKKNKNKKIDFLIYNRNYSVKNNFLRNNLLKILTKINLNIYAIGDILQFRNVKNLGFISRKKTNNLLKNTKYIINSGENPYNVFTIDAFNNHANIIYEKKFINKIKFFNKEKIHFIDFYKKKEIINILKKGSNKIKFSTLTKECKKNKNDIFDYFNSIKIYYSKS